MELDRFALDQHRLEGLNTQPMEGRRAVEQHRMFADDIVEDIPDVFAFLFDHLLGAFDRGDVASFRFELAVDEIGLNKSSAIFLRQATLMHAVTRDQPDDD